MRRFLLLGVSAVLMAQGQEYTRGIGVYPGDPKEDFSPVMAVDSATYRNLALHRPAYHSSSYDYNLTAQLVTDGIKTTALPRWISTATNDGDRHVPEPGAAPSGIPFEQLRLQSHRATGNGRDQDHCPAPLDLHRHQRWRRPQEKRTGTRSGR